MIDSNETLITGEFILKHGKLTENEACERINLLVTQYLVKVTTANWLVLYQDPLDKRYWELNYPQGHLQGGGPSSLKMLTSAEAKQKYSL